MKRSDVYWVDFGNCVGNIQGGLRLAVVVQNNDGNRYSPTTIVCPMTTRIKKMYLPTHVLVNVKGLNNVVLCEQVMTVNRSNFRNQVGSLSKEDMLKVDESLRRSLEL